MTAEVGAANEGAPQRVKYLNPPATLNKCILSQLVAVVLLPKSQQKRQAFILDIVYGQLMPNSTTMVTVMLINMIFSLFF